MANGRIGVAMRVGLLCGCMSILGGSLAMAQEFHERLIGRPLTRANCEVGGCTTETLAEAKQAEYELVITRSGAEYFWTSREGKTLRKTQGGAFTYFVSDASGYVKMTDLGGECLYTEHVTLGLQSVSYWGTCTAQ